jgi:hypothetical protein
MAYRAPVSEGEIEMKDVSVDWLSCTIRMVEEVMERHGFEEDEPKRPSPPPKPIDEKLSAWNKILRGAFLSRVSE